MAYPYDGSYDGAETCELVGIYMLSFITSKFKDQAGLYRDDGLFLCTVFISHSNYNFAFTITTVCKYHSNPKLAFIASSCNLTVIREYCLMSVAILWPHETALSQ